MDTARCALGRAPFQWIECDGSPKRDRGGPARVCRRRRNPLRHVFGISHAELPCRPPPDTAASVLTAEGSGRLLGVTGPSVDCAHASAPQGEGGRGQARPVHGAQLARAPALDARARQRFGSAEGQPHRLAAGDPAIHVAVTLERRATNAPRVGITWQKCATPAVVAARECKGRMARIKNTRAGTARRMCCT